MMSQTTPVTIKELVTVLDKKLDEKFKSICLQMDSLKDSVNFLSDKFDSILKRIDVIEAKCDNALRENKCLKDEVLRLSAIVNQQSEDINDMEQYSRKDCVEISGLPEEPGENTNALTIKVASLMGSNLEEKDISISHRIPSNAQQNQSYSSRLRPREGSALNKINLANQFPKEIVKFARRGTKDQFYHSRKHLKNKSTKYNGIFVPESLTPKDKLLFKDCLKFKKENNYKFIWTQNGRIYFRKDKDCPARTILNQQDLKSKT
jgi:hypothetical protein